MKIIRCSICKKYRPFTWFFKRKEAKSGRRVDCKRCCNERMKRRYHTPEGYAILIRVQRKYWASKKGKLSQQRGYKKYAQKNKEKRAAKSAVWNEIKYKRLEPIWKRKCQMCHKPAKHYHHHKGYSKEHKLVVTPLCTFCHKKAHRELLGPENPG